MVKKTSFPLCTHILAFSSIGDENRLYSSIPKFYNIFLVSLLVLDQSLDKGSASTVQVLANLFHEFVMYMAILNTNLPDLLFN